MHNELYISKYANKTLWMCQTYIIANSNLVKKKSLHKIFHVSTHITVCENTNTAKPSTTIFLCLL